MTSQLRENPLVFYQIPPSLPAELDELEEKIALFAQGQMEAAKFRGFRVPFGIYEQRKSGTYMVRIRATAGGITPAQLAFAADLAEKYGKPELHLTTRQELQIHDIRLSDLMAIARALPAAGLSSRGGGGNTIRNITADADAGLFASEEFDVTPWAVALSSRLIAESDSWNMPRKVKINFSAGSSDQANAMFSDLGFIARRQDGQSGFRVYVAGGMGARSAVGKLLFDFVPAENIYLVARGVKNFFNKYGNRKNKFRSRIRFLYDDLGQEKFMELLRQEISQVESTGLIKPAVLKGEVFEPRFAPLLPESADYRQWLAVFSRRQKDGLLTIDLPLELGDISSLKARQLAAFLGQFAENILRISPKQNFVIRNFPPEYTGNLFELLQGLDGFFNAPSLLANAITCTGAATCKLGITLPRGLFVALHKKLKSSNLDLSALGNVRLNISGCPNSCGQHVVADLGFYGRAGRKNGRLVPSYNIVAGGQLGDGQARLAQKAGEISARDLPSFTADLLAAYLGKSKKFASFQDYLEKEGIADIAEISGRYNSLIPDFADDKNYYFDWSSEEIFNMAERSEGECSAGIFDMIDSDRLLVKEGKQALEKEGPGAAGQNANLFNILLATCRMLLVTRGSEPADAAGVFRDFQANFISTGLVDARYNDLVEQGRKMAAGELISLERTKTLALADQIESLYQGMDNSFQFASQEQAPIAEKPEEKTVVEVKTEVIRHKDLRHVACPMNFVKTKVELAAMKTDDLLEVLLDDGQPIANVPGSVRQEGHEILSTTRLPEGHWSVIIKKK